MHRKGLGRASEREEEISTGKKEVPVELKSNERCFQLTGKHEANVSWF